MHQATHERVLSRLLQIGRYLPNTSLEGQWLAATRRREVERLSQQLDRELRAIEPGVVQRQPGAAASYDALLASAMHSLRSTHGSGPVGLLDRNTLLDRPEYCDSEACPQATREHILASIAWINECLGSYRLWDDLMAEDLRPRGRPTRVLDLAAGHAGFALDLKERHGGTVDVTASDLFDEYLAMGREQARRRGLDVRFLRQDATDLGNLEGDPYDVIVCTQSIHHFSPGMVARMLGEATRVARRAVWLIDAERSLLGAALMGTIALAYSRSWPVLHDTVVSLRKMYAEEELLLIGSLCPGLPRGATLRTGRHAPGFAFLRVGL